MFLYYIISSQQEKYVCCLHLCKQIHIYAGWFLENILLMAPGVFIRACVHSYRFVYI